MDSHTFSILITTKNRLQDLTFTLSQIDYLLEGNDVSCIITDDGSTDGTTDFIKANYPKINLITHQKSKGYIHCRNKLLNLAKSDFAISLDDDSHFLTHNPLELIADYFDANPKCGVAGLRVFWSKSLPDSTSTSAAAGQVKSFVGCGHVWRMKSWRAIPDYPEWFVFYGEEDFAAYQLFKKKIEVHYLPSVLIHHRVNLKDRKKDSDYVRRLRNSLSSGWYTFHLFFPLAKIPRLMAYTVWIQLKTKVFCGDFKAAKALALALLDLVFAIPKILRNSNRLTSKEYSNYINLPDAKLYWKPEN